MASQSPVTSQPLSILQKPGLSLLSLNTGPVGVGRKNSVCCVMFFSTRGFLSDFSLTKLLYYTMMVSTTVITDPLQEIEVDLPRLGSGEENFPYREI